MIIWLDWLTVSQPRFTFGSTKVGRGFLCLLTGSWTCKLQDHFFVLDEKRFHCYIKINSEVKKF